MTSIVTLLKHPTLTSLIFACFMVSGVILASGLSPGITGTELKGATFLTISALAYGLFGIFSRLIGDDFGAFSQNAIRNLFPFFIYGIILLLYRNQFKKILKKDIKWFLIWTLGGSSTTILTFIAFNHLPLGTTYFLVYSSMIASGLLVGSLLFKEKLTIEKILSLILSVVGLILIYSLSIDRSLIIYSLFAVIAGAVTGTWNTLSKKISGNYSNFQMLLFDTGASAVIAGSIAIMLSDKVPRLELSTTWLAMLGFVVIGFIGSNGVVLGFRYIEAQLGSLILPIEIVFAAIFGYLIFGELPSLGSLVGGICILIATLIVPAYALLTRKPRPSRGNHQKGTN